MNPDLNVKPYSREVIVKMLRRLVRCNKVSGINTLEKLLLVPPSVSSIETCLDETFWIPSSRTLTSLTILQKSAVPEVCLNNLNEFTELKELKLARVTHFRSWEILSCLKFLRSLVLTMCNIKDSDLTLIAKHIPSNMEYLSLRSNAITTLDPLKTLKLKVLSVSSCKDLTIRETSKLPATLKIINMTSIRISSMVPINELKSLFGLGLVYKDLRHFRSESLRRMRIMLVGDSGNEIDLQTLAPNLEDLYIVGGRVDKYRLLYPRQLKGLTFSTQESLESIVDILEKLKVQRLEVRRSAVVSILHRLTHIPIIHYTD